MKFLALAQCLVVARSLTTRPIIPSGFAVVARSVLPAASPAAPLVQHLLMLWPERFATKSAAKKACRRRGGKIKKARLTPGGTELQIVEFVIYHSDK